MEEVDWAQSMADFTKKKNPVASSLGSIAIAGLAGYFLGKK